MKFSTMALASTLALGLTCAAQASGDSFTGAYAGVKLGYGMAKNKIDGGQSFNSNAFCGDLFMGYGQTFDVLYAGLEAFVGSENQKKTQTVGGLPITYKSDLIYGLNGRLGAVVAPTTLVYVSCAAARVTDKYSAPGASISKNKTVFIPGVGAELMIPNTSLSARLDATYQLPSKVEGVKITKTTVKLGLAYRF